SGRKALETEEIEVGDVRISRVTVADREGGARHGDVDTESPARAADEGRLAGSELAGHGHDVADLQAPGEPGRNRFRLRRRSGHSRKMLTHFPRALVCPFALLGRSRRGRAERPARP